MFEKTLASSIVSASLFCAVTAPIYAQQPASASVTQKQTVNVAAPLTSAELVRLVRELPARPDLRDVVVEQIRRRGIGFALTSGVRSVVATKSGNDALLRRTLEEAERRRAGGVTGGVAAVLPDAAEAAALLERARAAAAEHAKTMPDFVVKQQIARFYARGTTRNWIADDRLTVAVSYRENAGEQYRLLATNGVPAPVETFERGDYAQPRGTSSTGEFVTLLATLFAPESQTRFQAVDTDTLRGQRTIVYEYEIKLENSRQQIRSGGAGEATQAITAGSRGRLWIDRDAARVWRIESIATDIPAGFPVQAAARVVDYEPTEIDARKYMMPITAEVELTSVYGARTMQTRNRIRFRDYKKYGSKVEIIEDDFVEEDVPPADQP